MFPVVLGLGAWLAKGVALATVLPRVVKAASEILSPAPPARSPRSTARPHGVFLPSRWKPIVYHYDNLSQLIGVDVNSTPAATFQFDPAGNLLSLTAGNITTPFTYNALNQRTTPGTNLYDAKGQTTDKDGRTFEWDDDGRMTAIVDGTHRSEFTYDGYGRRVRITEKEAATVQSDKLYWWLGGEIVCERDGIDPGFPITKRYFGQGVQVGATNLYYTFDQLGSVRELVDSSGVVRADYRYSTYGERTKVGGDLDSDWGYAGLFHHGPSGLDLATYRVYDSTMGRWISRDPLGEGVDYNLYRYCGNSPINFTDPEGLAPGLLTPIDRTVDSAGNGVFAQRPDYNGLTVPPPPASSGSPGSHGNAANTSAPVSPGNRTRPGEGGTWADNSIFQTHRDPNAASAGDVYTGGENAIRGTAEAAAMVFPGLLVGRATNGLRVTGFTKHGLNQKINRCITTPQFIDAIKHPRARPIWQAAQETWLIEGRNGVTVILNTAGEVVTVWRGRRP